MAWTIRNGNRYYYRKQRVNGRVVSIYCGTREQAERAAEEDKARAAALATERARQVAEIQAYDELVAVVAEFERNVRIVTIATLLVNGYHTHKGQWRKIRTKKSPESKPAKPRQKRSAINKEVSP